MKGFTGCFNFSLCAHLFSQYSTRNMCHLNQLYKRRGALKVEKSKNYRAGAEFPFSPLCPAGGAAGVGSLGLPGSAPWFRSWVGGDTAWAAGDREALGHRIALRGLSEVTQGDRKPSSHPGGLGQPGFRSPHLPTTNLSRIQTGLRGAKRV